MADVKISALPALTTGITPTTDVVPVVHNGITQKISITDLVTSTGMGGGTVTSASVVSANGLAGTVANATTTPAITLSTTVTGVVKGNGTALSTALNSDLPVMTATVGGAVPTPPNNTTTFLRGDGTFATPAGAGTGTVTHTAGALTANQLVIGNAADDIKVLGSLGTTTTVLHGNAAGAPTFGAVNLSNDVSGILQATTGGTGHNAYTVGDMLQANTATTLDFLAGVATGNALISGGVGTISSWGKVGLTTHVSGTLPVANGGTGAVSLTANNVILGNGTSAVQVVAPGTSGNVLTSNGTTWTSAAATGGASGLVCLAVASASNSATIDFTTVIDSTYDEYELHYINAVPATNAVFAYLRTSSNNGSSFDTGASDYYSGVYGIAIPAGTAITDTSSPNSRIYLSSTGAGISSTASDGGITGVLKFFSPSQTTAFKQMTQQATYSVSSSSEVSVSGAGGRLSTSAVNAIRFLFSAGNITSGLFKLYGVRKSV